MSSCQDSMDTEDSIPRPEYEDIVADEEDDDEEFWVENSRKKIPSLENGTQRQEAASSELPASSRSPPPVATASSNSNQSSTLNKDVDEVMEDEDEEVSYDEAEEEDDDDVDEESRKSLNKLENQILTETVKEKGDPLKIPDEVPQVDTATSSITVVTPPSTKNNKLVLVTLINENGKVLVPLPQRQAKPVTATTLVESSSTVVTPEEEKISPMEDIKISQLTTPKEDPQRSTTPSRGTREFLALQKAFTESKVLSEFFIDNERSRKSRKVPLKSKDSTTGDDSEKEKFRICRGRSKSCTRTLLRGINLLNNLNSSAPPQRWPSDEKLNSKRENMRSQNTEFVQKQMKFLSRVNHEQTGDEAISDASDGEQSLNESNKTVESKDEYWQPPPKKGSDSFCWKCRKCADLIACSKCPRSYHYKCIKVGTTTRLDKTWICPECVNLESCLSGSKK